MNKVRLLLFWIFCCARLSAAQNQSNLVFNGDFELGTDGFAIERRVRPDTNPRLQFRRLETDAFERNSGKRSLKLSNPCGEECRLFSREFDLEPDTEYLVSMDIKHTGEGRIPFSFSIATIQSHQDWHSFSHEFNVGPQWERYTYRFRTKERKRPYYCEGRLAWITADLLIDNLKVEPLNSNGVKRDLDITVATDRKWYVSKSEHDPVALTFKAWNRSSGKISKEIAISGQDEYTGERLWGKTVAIDLEPGETCAISFTEKLSRYGCVRIRVENPEPGWEILDGFYTVFGNYAPNPVDITRDFVVSASGGTYYHVRPKFRHDSYQCFNGSLDEMLEIYEAIGLRLIREHDAGETLHSWFVLEKQEGVYDFSHMDRVAEMYARRNIEFLPVLGSSNFIIRNDWWSSRRWPEFMDRRLIHIKNDPPNVLPALRGYVYRPPREDWKRHVSSVAAHLRGKVKAYEIINEACHFFSPEIYTELLRDASESIRREDPLAKVVGFCVTEDQATQWSGWLEQCLKLGGLQYVDTVSIHPYGSRELSSPIPADKQIENLFSMVKQYSAGPVPGCWNSELYYLYDEISGEFQGHIQPFHATARFLVDLGEGLGQSISINADQLWKKVLTPGSNAGVSWHELIPNETAVAYNALARYFEGSRPVAKYRLGNNNICYVYRRKTGSLIAAVWNYEKQENSKADLRSFEVLDLFGNPVPPGVLTLKRDPYYILPKQSEKEFLNALKNLSCELSEPWSASPLVRIINGKAHGTLVNSSSRNLSPNFRFTGSGYSSPWQTADVQANREFTFSLPMRKDETSETPGKLEFEFDGNKQTVPAEVIHSPLWESGEMKQFQSEDGLLKCSGVARLKGERCDLTLEILDASDSGPLGDRMPWETDCIELFIDLTPERIPLKHPQFYLPDTFRLFIMPRNAGNDRIRLMGDAVEKSDISCQTEMIPGGYKVSLSFPVARRQTIGFDIKVNDSAGADSPARREATWGKGTALFRNRCNFGILSRQQKDEKKDGNND